MSNLELDVWQVWSDESDYGLFMSLELAKRHCENVRRGWKLSAEAKWEHIGNDNWRCEFMNPTWVFTIRKRGVTIVDESWDFITTEKAYFRLISRISAIFAKVGKTKGWG